MMAFLPYLAFSLTVTYFVVGYNPDFHLYVLGIQSLRYPLEYQDLILAIEDLIIEIKTIKATEPYIYNVLTGDIIHPGTKEDGVFSNWFDSIKHNIRYYRNPEIIQCYYDLIDLKKGIYVSGIQALRHPLEIKDFIIAIKNLLIDIEIIKETEPFIYNVLTGETIYPGTKEDAVFSNWFYSVKHNIRHYTNEQIIQCYYKLLDLKKGIS